MSRSKSPADPKPYVPDSAALFADPRKGDAEDDASSTKARSLLAIGGSLLAEISVPKLLMAWTMLILLPSTLLGLAPLVVTAWLTMVSGKIGALTGVWTLVALFAVILLGWVAGQPLFRMVETNFWSLNALAVQPGYALAREALRHLVEGLFSRQASALQRARLRAMCALGAGLLLCGIALWIATLIWPFSRWMGALSDLAVPHRMVVPVLANAVVLVAGYLAVAALVWGIADASMDQPLDLVAFDTAPAGARTWRVAHLSDTHTVGERYGFRIECGRSGPRGNDRLLQTIAHIDAIHAARPLDLVLISGDLTDAGRSTEWAEFLDVIARYPALATRMLVLPGNHDVNIVDRANPARLDLPFSPGQRLRQMRAISAIAALQGDRVQIFDHGSGRLKGTLAEAFTPYRELIAKFADAGSLHLSIKLRHLWNDLFPMMLPPDTDDGLGVLILNSNAETHFSFTNALGVVSAEQTRCIAAADSLFPRARWIVALHHHPMEYPMPVGAFSERIGTALVNGTWFVRQLRPLAGRAVVMHGHRHIDWIGQCGGLKLVSGPSPIMGGKDHEPAHFHIHTLAGDPRGQLHLLPPERVDIDGLCVT
jgi:3',5'-cyclic AMP phosphodiesterase CpdA